MEIYPRNLITKLNANLKNPTLQQMHFLDHFKEIHYQWPPIQITVILIILFHVSTNDFKNQNFLLVGQEE